MDENQKIEQEKILTEGYGWSCYCFARDIPGADKERLLKRSKELELKEK